MPGLVHADAERRRQAVELVLSALEAQLAAPFAEPTTKSPAQAMTETKRPENVFGFDGGSVLACCIARCVANLAEPSQMCGDVDLARRYARVADAVSRLDFASVEAYLKRNAAKALPALTGVVRGPHLALKCAALTDAAARGDVDMLRTICLIKPDDEASQAIKRKCAAHASIVCVERAQSRVGSGTAPRWRGLFLPRGFERREATVRGAVIDAHSLLAETARADVDDCRAATAGSACSARSSRGARKLD